MYVGNSNGPILIAALIFWLLVRLYYCSLSVKIFKSLSKDNIRSVMPRPKKVEKQKKEEIVLDLRQDREEFLRAFEKPTQIYRFLRARHCISPAFLHRNLLYMLDRCSRTNARRKVFHVDDMLTLCLHHQNVSGQVKPAHFNQLQIVVSGFYIDPGVQNHITKKLSTVETEISVRKTYCRKRKDGESLHSEEELDVVEVPVNPKTTENCKEEVVTLNTTQIYQSVDGQSVKNYSLIFRVYEPADDHSDSSSSQSDSDVDIEDDDSTGEKRKLKDDPAAVSLKNLTTGTRRRRTKKSADSDSEEDAKPVEKIEPLRKFKKLPKDRMETAIYEADLDVYTSEKETSLVDGIYELSLRRHIDSCGDGRRNATWEALGGGKEIKVLSAMTHSPVLKFKLNWSECDKLGPLSEHNDDNKTASNGEPEAKRMRRRPSYKEDEKSAFDGEKVKEALKLPVDRVHYKKVPTSWRQETNANSGVANGLHNAKPTICYQFIYNSETQQQTEARDDFYCPWCQLNCITLFGLIKHLKTIHPRFNFSYIPQGNGCCIEVSVNDCYDGSYCGNPQFVFSQPGMAFNRRGPIRRIEVTDTLFYRPTRERRITKHNLNELLENEEDDAPAASHYSAGHHRLYFHSGTNIPIRPCEFDNDSEDEPDPDWLKEHIKKMLDEFTDVNDGEKPVMKMWNLYIMKHSCIADIEMYDTCKAFIDTYGHTLARCSLRRNLLLHLVNLVDFGVLKTSALLSLMQHFDSNFEREHETKSKVGVRKEVSFSPSKRDEAMLKHGRKSEQRLKMKEESDAKQLERKSELNKLFDMETSTRLSKLQMIIDEAERSAELVDEEL